METRMPVIEALEKIGCARNTLYKLMNLHGIESTRKGNQRFLKKKIMKSCLNSIRQLSSEEKNRKSHGSQNCPRKRMLAWSN